MLEISRFDASRRVRGTALLSGALVAYIALTLGLFPSIRETGEDFDAYLETLPPEIARLFVGNVTTITSIEGYLVSQLYQFGWVLILGVYFAYSAASIISSDVEHGQADFLLSLPITRTRYVLEKFLALVPVVVAINAVAFVAVWVGIELVDESIPLADLVAVHALSVPYLLACGAVGLFASVLFDSVRRSQTVGVGAIFAMFLLDTLTFATDYAFLGDLAFQRYFDPAEALVHGDLAWVDATILLLALLAFVVASALVFEGRDVNG